MHVTCFWLNTAHVIRVYSANTHMCYVIRWNIFVFLFICGRLCSQRGHAASWAQSVHGNIDVHTDAQSMNQARCPPMGTWVYNTVKARPRKGYAEKYEHLERKWCDRVSKRDSTGLTISCCHQGLELFSFSWWLGPGAGSHCNLGSPGCPVKRRTVNNFVLYSVRMCLAPCFDSWRFMM